METLRVPFEEMVGQLRRVLLAVGMRADRAELCARLFTETDRDGVYSHGLRRFRSFVGGIERGVIDAAAEPRRVGGFGAAEQWDGQRGPGNLNAHACMARAIALAGQFGLGCVAQRNTNHWLRAGSYGWQAAEAGCIGICWTNTEPNMPPWGAKECRLGNNPLVVAVPREGGHVVLDMAMTQFSWGKIALHADTGRPLPAAGGYDEDGRLTCDAAAIKRSTRALPIGLWKGAGLSLVLDLAAAALADGAATRQLGGTPAVGAKASGVDPSAGRAGYPEQHGPSQVFLAFDLEKLVGAEQAARTIEPIVDYMLAAEPAGEGEEVHYPGRRTLRTRQENTARGIPVDPQRWREILAMGAGGP